MGYLFAAIGGLAVAVAFFVWGLRQSGRREKAEKKFLELQNNFKQHMRDTNAIEKNRIECQLELSRADDQVAVLRSELAKLRARARKCTDPDLVAEMLADELAEGLE